MASERRTAARRTNKAVRQSQPKEAVTKGGPAAQVAPSQRHMAIADLTSARPKAVLAWQRKYCDRAGQGLVQPKLTVE